MIGLPDPKWIEAVTAIIVRRDGHTLAAADVLGHCAAHLSGFKIPKTVVLVAHLPRNASGKILKRELRLSLLDRELRAGPDPGTWSFSVWH